MKIPKEFIQSIHKITVGNGSGTAFEICRDGKYFLVTAAHCITDDQILILHEKQNKKLEYVSIKKHPFADIALIELKQKLHGEVGIEPDMFYFGEEVSFLGFPYNLSSGFQEINDGFDIPFVKSGIISAFNNKQIFIDGHNNPGFSGGPLAVNRDGKFLVVGVISGYLPEKKELFSENSGIGYATRISLLNDLF